MPTLQLSAASFVGAAVFFTNRQHVRVAPAFRRKEREGGNC